MAFTHTKKVYIGSYIKARIRIRIQSWRSDPDPTKKVRIRPDPVRIRIRNTGWQLGLISSIYFIIICLNNVYHNLGCRFYPGRTPLFACALRTIIWGAPMAVGVSCSVAWPGVGGASLGGGLACLYCTYMQGISILLRVNIVLFLFVVDLKKLFWRSRF
jgi:hypothetical protein